MNRAALYLVDYQHTCVRDYLAEGVSISACKTAAQLLQILLQVQLPCMPCPIQGNCHSMPFAYMPHTACMRASVYLQRVARGAAWVCVAAVCHKDLISETYLCMC